MGDVLSIGDILKALVLTSELIRAASLQLVQLHCTFPACAEHRIGY